MKRFHSFRKKLGLPQSREDFFLDFGGKSSASKIFGLYSPRFAPRPLDGPANMEVPGFPFYEPRDEGRRRLSESLCAFLSSGSAPIVFTLGSFAPQVSGDFYDVSIRAARSLGRRAVLLAGAKDAERLSGSAGPNEFVCSEAPHDELFPHASCVVHHGGIGTTAQALRAGKPQLVVPFFGDQPDHGERVRRLRLGLALKLSSYDLRSVTRALAELCDDSYLRAARDFALSILRRAWRRSRRRLDRKRFRPHGMRELPRKGRLTNLASRTPFRRFGKAPLRGESGADAREREAP
ncbi:glycosyltransferase [Methylosinus trichosporium]|uniref:glycosyltransferase n=1 Tax=Methylosinus trichosporium TaxID=426 RepID=UPI0024B975E0|nr:glycosyltransferase [Methylosinus trichosporium]